MVPLAAPGLYFVSVREKTSAETPFQTVRVIRVYLKRLPSGALRLTVLSPSLPRPVFRSYPAGTSEAEAVARAVGRALSTLENSDCQLDEGNTASQGDTDNGSEKANGIRYLNRVAHGLPSPFPCGGQQTADSQHGADNDETAPVELVAHRGHEVMQHRRPPLRLRVLWQGLL